MPHKFLSLLLAVGVSLPALADSWSPVKDAMLTRWGQTVTPDNAWREYPRPQLVRPSWTNLNGRWDFALTDRGGREPAQWERRILVPFAVETPLSGIGERVRDDQAMWYRRSFTVEAAASRSTRTLLHFEGVDYACQVWVNGRQVGTHRGGNLPFSFEITDAIRTGDNELKLRVIDDTDAFDRYQLRGKQKVENSGIWYTPSSGIWQTVWLEQVPSTFLADLKLVADADGRLDVRARVDGAGATGLRVAVSREGEVVATGTSRGDRLNLQVRDPRRWSPSAPHLYDVQVTLLGAGDETLDAVESYVGFRSIGRVQDADGHWRFTLNGQTIFHWGPLDQGWWPDGFLNPPSDEAIVFEMNFLRDAGFNMIRKHKKVEPRRYYYHADRLGLLVWQDHVSGGAGPNEWPKWKKLRADLPDYQTDNPNWWLPADGDALDADWPDWAHAQSMAELKTMIDTLHNHPCVVVWTTFNERWGQHRSLEVGQWVMDYDPTRHLNIASGGNFFPIGHIADEHNYPHPRYPLELPVYDDYIKVMGEFGGHGWLVAGHQWDPNKNNWGYGGLPKTIEEYRERYVESIRRLADLKARGVAAGVYTQTTDVEGEINGLLTYDREVFKLSPADLAEIHAAAGLLD